MQFRSSFQKYFNRESLAASSIETWGKGRYGDIKQISPGAIFHSFKNGYFQMKKYDIFLSGSKHRLLVHVRIAQPRRFQRVPTIYVLEQKQEKMYTV